MFSIRVEFLTDDERLKKICHLYWELAEEPNFTHSVTSLARDFALSSRDLKAIVDENCNAFSSNHTCPRCEQPQIYTSRSEYQQKYRWGKPTNYVLYV